MNYISPLITVLLPVFNVELYIKECINSVLNQTIQDFEIIVIDDCSTDATLTIISSFKDSRIRIIKKEKNKGLIDSLNIGFKEAKGKYIARMDGDDINELDRFEKQITILERNSDIILCGSWIQHFGKSKIIVKHKEYHNDILTQLLLNCSLSMCCSMFNREFLYKNKFDETKKHVEDYDFLSRVVWSGKFYNIQEVLYHYRVHDLQVSTIYNKIQVNSDISIKLFLFKKIDYDSIKYTDDLISKMLLLNQPIQIEEFSLFLNWLKVLVFLNHKTKIYPQNELEIVLKRIKRTLLFNIFFKKTTIGITKHLRFKILFKLNLLDALYILRIKSRELRKAVVKSK